MEALFAPKVRLVLEDRPSATATANHAECGTPLARLRFDGTDNPRERRLLAALLLGPLPRERADRVAGASNSPDWVMNLRSKGLAIPCKRTASKDRDGRACQPGTYSFADGDRRVVVEWMERKGISIADLARAGGR